MRINRVRLGFVAALFLGGAACIPDPAGDFDDFGDRIAPFSTQFADAGSSSFDGAPPTEAVKGQYYGACLTQLAFGQPTLVFNFLADVEYVPEGGVGRLSMKLTALRTGEGGNRPPPTVSRAGTIGETYGFDLPATPNVSADAKYQADLGVVKVPGEANPVTRRNVIIERTALLGRFTSELFCAQLSGQVTQPINLKLTGENNICQFVPIQDGDPTPQFTDPAQFAASACPG